MRVPSKAILTSLDGSADFFTKPQGRTHRITVRNEQRGNSVNHWDSILLTGRAGSLCPICKTGTSQIICEIDGFCEVQGATACGLKNLLTATEAIGNDECVRQRLAHSRQQHAFAGGLRDRVFVTFEAKGPGHTATSRIKRLQFGAHFTNERFGVCHFHERFLMAVAV